MSLRLPRCGARRRTGLSPASYRRSRRREGADEPVAIGAVLEALSAGRPWAAGLAVGRLSRTWHEVVGERLALECWPAGLEGGVLTVRAASAAWGAQIRFLEDQIRGRANAALGGGKVVSSVRVSIADAGDGRDSPGAR
jgi:predicted nucleic acid-binding Zn ribbon protein